MRRLLVLLLALLPTLAFAQNRRGGDWQRSDVKGCIGGSECRERRLAVPLDDDRPVIAVQFNAHDQIGERAEGRLRVKIDGNTIREGIDVPRRGDTFTIDVDELVGRQLVFEASNDEVEIDQIAVLYGRATPRRIVPRDRPATGGGWRAYPSASGCIAGDECRKNGNRITIALENAPVIGIRFWAHDQIGTRADGRLSVRIDDAIITSYIDVQRNGRRHELEVENVRGTRLVIQAETNDEVEVSEVEVLYGRGDRGYRGVPPETRHEGGCVGGSECGGRRARIRIPLRDYPVVSIRLYARDDVGTRAGGELRIRIDDTIVRDYLDIPRDGRNFDFKVDNVTGQYLIIEPAEDDEVVVKDVRVRYGED